MSRGIGFALVSGVLCATLALVGCGGDPDKGRVELVSTESDGGGRTDPVEGAAVKVRGLVRSKGHDGDADVLGLVCTWSHDDDEAASMVDEASATLRDASGSALRSAWVSDDLPDGWGTSMDACESGTELTCVWWFECPAEGDEVSWEVTSWRSGDVLAEGKGSVAEAVDVSEAASLA